MAFPATARLSRLRPSSRLGRLRLGLTVSLVVLTAAAWWLTLDYALRMSMPMGIVVRGGMDGDGMAGMAMAGMASAGWSAEGAIVFTAVWTVMMAAMMLPATAPMVLIFASAQGRRGGAAAISTWIFVAGYLIVWAAVGVLVYVVVEAGSDLATALAAAERSRWAPLALGATLMVAGLYQFTPLKRACLGHCRSPLAFLAQHWRAGRRGALVMGLRHGAYCLGCCWALFAVMAAAGVMSLAWMLLLTLIVFVEKVSPQGERASAATGMALAALGIMVALGAVPMPGLVLS
jgi:predicted metal-binding membrane protein